jgi:peptidoglycan/LPS O-acetylase OafA/YrhL
MISRPGAFSQRRLDARGAQGRILTLPNSTMPLDKDAPPFYRPELDGLRFVAFFCVFISHAFSDDASRYLAQGVPWPFAYVISQLVHVGRFGVPLFFVLSSYLITELLIREHRKTGTIDVKRFYLRRALRIWPLYVVFVLVISVLLRATGGPSAFPADYLLALLLFSGNWATMLQWGPGPGDMISIALWSVSVEEQFYLAWPLLLGMVGMARIRQLSLLLIGTAVLSRLAMDMAGASETTVWYSSLTWLDSIGAGALLAVGLRGKLPRFAPTTRLLLFAAGPVLWLLAAVIYNLLPASTLFYPPIVAGSVSLFLSAAGGTAFAHPVLVYLGRRSYGLYVVHLAGLALAAFILPRLSLGGAALAFAFTVLMAAASYRWLETPFLALKSRFAYIDSRPI